MIVTIVPIVALLVLVCVIAGLRFLYLLISPKNTMQSDTKNKALDILVYLGIAIALIASVTNILEILFTAVDLKFRDMFSETLYVDATQSDVRFAIASLVIMFPIYIGLSSYTAKNIEKYLYKQDISVRKIMIYCTLFVAVLTLIGTLVSVIYTYLGGELSLRFELKALCVFAVALALFGYYYYALTRDYSKKTFIPTTVTIITTLFVISSIVWSVSIIGTPTQMRAKKIDSTRLSDISRIQQEILNRIQTTDKLPLTLTELDNAFQGYQVPTDPVTKEAYTYKVVTQPNVKVNYATNKKELTTSAVFELCANFDTVRNIDARGQVLPSGIDTTGAFVTDRLYLASNQYFDGDMSPFWNHDLGETCFKRVIAPDMYYGK